MPSKYQHIDELNKKAWELRYASLDESRKSAEQALDLSTQENYPRGKAYARLNLAVNHFLKSENKESLELLNAAMKYFSKNKNEEGFSITLTFIGNIYESFGDYETGLEYCQDALRNTREIEYKEGEGEVQSVIGLIYSRLSDYDNALKAYRESMEIRAELGDQPAVASSLNRIARIFALRKDYEKALENYMRSLKIREELNQVGALPWTYLGLASTYEDMGDFDNARVHYQKNLEEGCEGVDKRCKLQSMLGMGRVMLEIKDFEEAYKYLTESRDLAEKLNAKPLLYESNHALAHYFEATGDPAKALEHYRKYHRLREEVHNDETRNRMKNQQVAFAIEKSEKEKEIYQLRNVELKAAYDEIHEQNVQITDSINYASRIQSALLPQKAVFEQSLSDHFILFLPCHIVSGDYYWASNVNKKVVFAAADCTGHGVPGAFMSMLGISFLNEIVDEKHITDPGQILDELRKNVMKALKQTGKDDEQKDGMDIALCVYNPDKKILEYAGAYNPLYLVRQGELEEFKADRMPIGYYTETLRSFQSQKIDIKKGDVVYMFSDGYADQFGGEEGKKLKYKALKNILLEIHQQPMEEQKKYLYDAFIKWRGDYEQIDDVILIGVRF